ncbi:MAG: tetratricopeptide repeat protein [Acidobacteriia bacterium]|nr:tetratricopeptide repeat protein [Terriglobia bacterium]
MEPLESTPPKVFISYSHDTPVHESTVLALSDRLRRDGIDAILDQYETFPPQGWPLWGEQQIQTADFVLVVSTQTYRRRFDSEEEPGKGLGVSWEARFIRQLLYNSGGMNRRFVPVLLTNSDREHIPLLLQGYDYCELDTEQGYEHLLRILTDCPKASKPGLGALPARERKPDFRNLVWNVPPRNPLFTGREDHLEVLRTALARDRSAALTQPQAISGLGGIGKTQTAIEYAYRHQDEYRAALWITADSRDALVSGCAAIASLLGLPEKDEKDLNLVAAAVHRWLESQSGWLLILDNVEDLADIARPFLPVRPAGHILITTRLHATGTIAQSVELQKMEPDEGALFLLRRAKVISPDAPLAAACDADRTAAREISEEVGGLPLALDQAGAFVEEVPSTLAEYIELYRAEGAKLRARRGNLSDHLPVTTTFSLAFARVAERNPRAADLIRVCAFLAPEAIPEEIFLQGGKELGDLLAQLVGNPLAYLEAVEEAGKFALIHRNVTDKSLDIHRLVQDVLQDEMDEQQQRVWADQVVRALDEAFPSVEFQSWARSERLLPHAKAAARLVEYFASESPAAARLLNQSACYLDDRAQYEEAEPLYQRALAIWEKVVGPEHPNTAAGLNNLAMLYYHQGRYSEAEPLWQRALVIAEKVLGPDHPNTASNVSNLAELYETQGRYSETEPLLQRTLASRERVQGPDHPDTASSLNNLAGLYYHQGRYSEAGPLYQRALAVWEKVLGVDHPNTASSLNNLALLYANQGRFREAEPLYQRALTIQEKVLGPDHPNTASSLNSLACLYDQQGLYSEAQPLLQRALAIRAKVLGPDHPDTAQSFNNLAFLCDHQARYLDAEPFYQRALAIWEKVLGPDHPKTALCLNNLALLYDHQGRYGDAEPLYQRALAIAVTVLGPGHPNTATVLANYTALLRLMGRDGEAAALQTRARPVKP